jgi:hypothetical protein
LKQLIANSSVNKLKLLDSIGAAVIDHEIIKGTLSVTKNPLFEAISLLVPMGPLLIASLLELKKRSRENKKLEGIESYQFCSTILFQ